MNINPQLVLGITQNWANDEVLERKLPIRPDQIERKLEIRVYNPDGGQGFFSAGTRSPRWLYRDGPSADHMNRASDADVEAAIKKSGMVQVVAGHIIFGTWRTWDEFAKSVFG